MPKHRKIFDTRDLSGATDEVLKRVDRAVLAAAFKIRDEMRDQFKKDITLYKYATDDYYKMAEGIMVGKLTSGKVKIHSFGHRENTGDWKARFFVGGTTYRKNQKGNKGLIKYNDAVDDGLKNADTILSNYIKNTIEN
jgi:hypothetical protein